MQEEFKDTNGVIRTHKSKSRQHNGVIRTHKSKGRQHNGVIRTHKSKGRQHNDQQKKEQTTIYKTLQINLRPLIILVCKEVLLLNFAV